MRLFFAIGCCVLVFGLALDITTSTVLGQEENRMSEIRGKWSGTLEQFSHDIDGSFPVELTVEAISGGDFTGTMYWPTFNGCRTRVQGQFVGQLIKWTETEYLQGDEVVLYGLYVAKFKADNEITGEWMDPKHTIDPNGPKFGVPGARFTLRRG
jgi:hypothetical protein